jgi:2,4-dienoyl-CoA reductase-like NADH-dependent reductase (Old Yellow Enzyme family)
MRIRAHKSRPECALGTLATRPSGSRLRSSASRKTARPQPSFTLAPLVDLLHRGEFDLVALGRAVLADAYWAAKVAESRLSEIRPYDKSADAYLS